MHRALLLISLLFDDCWSESRWFLLRFGIGALLTVVYWQRLLWSGSGAKKVISIFLEIPLTVGKMFVIGSP